ncbi:hypothetical protein ACLOJK_027784 [Asimina triloba]
MRREVEDTWALQEAAAELLKTWEKEENRRHTRLHTEQAITLSLMAARGAQKGVDARGGQAHAQWRPESADVADTEAEAQSLGAEATKEPSSKEEFECAFEAREVLDPRSKYGRTSEERQAIQESLDSFNMEAKPSEQRGKGDTSLFERGGHGLSPESRDPFGSNPALTKEERQSMEATGKRVKVHKQVNMEIIHGGPELRLVVVVWSQVWKNSCTWDVLRGVWRVQSQQ